MDSLPAIHPAQATANPNHFDREAAKGKKIFEREGCAGCHTPPLYSNNKLTFAEGFVPSEEALRQYEILHVRPRRMVRFAGGSV